MNLFTPAAIMQPPHSEETSHAMVLEFGDASPFDCPPLVQLIKIIRWKHIVLHLGPVNLTIVIEHYKRLGLQWLVH
jgi:hypothetical protein